MHLVDILRQLLTMGPFKMKTGGIFQDRYLEYLSCLELVMVNRHKFSNKPTASLFKLETMLKMKYQDELLKKLYYFVRNKK